VVGWTQGDDAFWGLVIIMLVVWAVGLLVFVYALDRHIVRPIVERRRPPRQTL
jgi:uncharacterized membrane protein